MEKVSVMGIKIGDRVNSSKEVQGVLTEFGCIIKTRLGLHEAGKGECGRAGLIILELIGDTSEWEKLQKKLESIKGIEVQNMKFDL